MANEGTYLITRGDDCGSSLSANRGIQEAYNKGILKNTSVMAPCSALDHAAEIFAGESGLCFGLHATLNAEWDRLRWGPVLPPEKVPSLVRADGTFFQTPQELKDHKPLLEEMMAELQAQLDKVRRLGFVIHYADLHMGFDWVHDGFRSAFGEWCKREGLINDLDIHRSLPIVAAASEDPVDDLITRLKAADSGQYVLVGHPAYDNDEMRFHGHKGYEGNKVAAERENERRMFTDPRVAECCRLHSIIPIRYDEAIV